jgi:DnaJ-class molecular chaperone
MKPFKLLNIPPTNDKMAIRRAYVQAVKKHHPDVTGNDSTHLQQITQAYHQLIDTDFTQDYIDTAVTLSLADFLYGCVATVILKDAAYYGTVIEFTVSPFTYPGTTVEFYNMGSTNKLVRVKLNETVDQTYSRCDQDITVQKQINILDAELGTTINVTNFDGTIRIITIPPETDANQLTYMFNGDGFYNKNNKRGTLTVVVSIKPQRYTNV